jgi:hypothetical protein
VITCKISQRYQEAIATGNTALALYEKSSNTPSCGIQKKIIFNFIEALCAEAERLFPSHQHDALALHTQAKNLVHEHQEALSTATITRVTQCLSPLHIDTSKENVCATTAPNTFESTSSAGSNNSPLQVKSLFSRKRHKLLDNNADRQYKQCCSIM